MRGVLLLVHEVRVEERDFYGKKNNIKTIGKLILWFINQVFAQHKLNAPEHLKDMLRRLDSCMSKNFWPISLIPSLP